MGTAAIETIAWTASLVALLVAAGMDLKVRIIPNLCVAVVAVSGVLLVLALRPGDAGSSLLGAGLVFSGLGVLAHFGGLGGGDVKLISAVTFLVPSDEIVLLLAEIALAGGALALLYLAAHRLLARAAERRGPWCLVARMPAWLAALFRDERARIATLESLPYGLAVLGGVGVHGTRELQRCISAISCSL